LPRAPKPDAHPTTVWTVQQFRNALSNEQRYRFLVPDCNTISTRLTDPTLNAKMREYDTAKEWAEFENRNLTLDNLLSSAFNGQWPQSKENQFTFSYKPHTAQKTT